ncbi:MAG: C39 family peptidase [Patescibacteria group bacterium]|jgi:hypothetical protein
MKIKHFLLIASIFTLVACQNQTEVALLNQNNSLPEVQATTTPSSTNKTVEPIKPTTTVKTEPKPVEPVKPVTPIIENNEIPKFLDYPVAFASQAPFSNWDALHEEACEEAAMIMAVKYFKKEPLSPHLMEQGILNLVKWEEENGYQVDVTADEATSILKNYFAVSAKTTTDVSVENIKKQLLAGQLIIVPAAGRQLGNPNFTGAGPIYHMLVIRGYDDNKGEFITNDPGTRKGEGYRYKYQKLIAAIHDWDHTLAAGGMTDQEMEQGRKVVIIVNE